MRRDGVHSLLGKKMQIFPKSMFVFSLAVVCAVAAEKRFSPVELIFPEKFEAVTSTSLPPKVNSGDRLLVAKAREGATIEVAYETAIKLTPEGLAAFLEEGKKALASHKQLRVRRTEIAEKTGRKWGVMVMDLTSTDRALVCYTLTTSYDGAVLQFDFLGPKRLDEFLEKAVVEFMEHNPLK